MKHNTQFFVEYFALDLLMASDGMCLRAFFFLFFFFAVGIHATLLLHSYAGSCQGVIALNMEDGTLHRFRSAQTILATGVS